MPIKSKSKVSGKKKASTVSSTQTSLSAWIRSQPTDVVVPSSIPGEDDMECDFPEQTTDDQRQSTPFVDVRSSSSFANESTEEIGISREPNNASQTRFPMMSAQTKVRFERLHKAREMFFEKLNTKRLEEGAHVDEDFLDDLYLLAMSWRSHEDVVWPS